MDIKHLSEEIKKIDNLADSGRIRLALGALERVAATFGDEPTFKHQAMRLAETYGYVVSYALSGAADPGRGKMIDTIVRSIKELGRRMRRHADAADRPGLYYSTIRYNKMQPGEALPALQARYFDALGRFSMIMLTDPALASDNAKSEKSQLENIEKQWFKKLWTEFPLSDSDAESVRGLLQSDGVGSTMKILTVGALMLGNLEFFDANRIALLLDACAQPNREVSLRASVALVITLTMVDDKALLSPFKDRIDSLADNRPWRDDLKLIFTQLLTTRDTDRITRKINDEILPSMKEIGKDFDKMARKINPDDPESIENSTEWMELMENSGLAAKMREMNEIQESGGDVMMTTFGQLKNFAFFNEISNWFLPFDPSRSEIAATMAAGGPIADMLASPAMGMMCDNDRYSIVLAIANMPSAQNQFLMQQLEAHSSQMAEAAAAALDSDRDNSAAIVTNYVRSLYRFFKLFNRKSEFSNPFDTALNILAVDVLRGAINRDEFLTLASQFYFTHGYWADALPLLKELKRLKTGGEAELYFRIGCCHSALGNHQEALTNFEKSELFDADYPDLKLKLAVANRELGNHKRAAEYFAEVSAARGGDDKIDLFTAASLAEIERYAQAAELLYRIDFNRGLSAPFVRRLARCEYMLGHYDKCIRQLDRLKQLKPDDYLLYGAIEVNRNDYKAAVRYFTALRQKVGVARLDELVSSLKPTFRDVDPEILSIIIDEASVE